MGRKAVHFPFKGHSLYPLTIQVVERQTLNRKGEGSTAQGAAKSTLMKVYLNSATLVVKCQKMHQ